MVVNHHNGSSLTCVISSCQITVDNQPCSVTTLRDITQQQRAEAALKASEEKFAKAFHSSPDAITLTERSTGRYLEVNDGFCRLTGYSSAEVIGRTVYEIGIWADDKQRAALLTELRERGRVHHREMLGRNKRGDILTVEVSVEPLSLNEADCLLLTARDVSQLKNAQAQIRHLAYHDPLTNLPNRALLMDRLSQQIALLKRHNLRGALLFWTLTISSTSMIRSVTRWAIRCSRSSPRAWRLAYARRTQWPAWVATSSWYCSAAWRAVAIKWKRKSATWPIPCANYSPSLCPSMASACRSHPVSAWR